MPRWPAFESGTTRGDSVRARAESDFRHAEPGGRCSARPRRETEPRGPWPEALWHEAVVENDPPERVMRRDEERRSDCGAPRVMCADPGQGVKGRKPRHNQIHAAANALERPPEHHEEDGRDQVAQRGAPFVRLPPPE